MSRLRTCLLFPRRHPGWFLLAVVFLGLGGFGLWRGYLHLQFKKNLGEAKEALSEYDFERARQTLAECIRLRPNDPGVRLLAAQAARRDGDLAEAEKQLQSYQELVEEPTPEGALQWSLLWVQRGEMKEVDSLISMVDYRHPDTEQILEALAGGSIHTYNLKRASFWLNELLERYPENPIGRWLNAETTNTLGNEDLALGELRKLVEEYPRNTKFRQSLAQMLISRQKYEEALEHYEALHRRQPEDVGSALGLAHCLDRLERSDEARPLLRQLQEDHPDNSNVLLARGRLAIRDRLLPEAERLLRHALRLAPFDHQVQMNLGICLQQQGKRKEGKEHIDRAKKIEADLIRLEKLVGSTLATPEDPAPRLEAGQICLRYGQSSEGLRWLYGALAVAPGHKPTHKALADYFASQGDAKQAENHRQKAGNQ